MKILVVDQVMEHQLEVARVLDGLSRTDRDILDIKISLANQRTYLDKVSDNDVLILGPGLLGRYAELCHSAKAQQPDIEILIFVSDEAYSSNAFREALAAHARKVIPLGAPPLDLLQELMQIFECGRQSGRTSDGRLVVITQAKGGLGATTLAAALGEAAGEDGRKVLLWDLDIESKDLSRGLLVGPQQASVVTSWVSGAREISRESLNDALAPLAETSGLLPPPDSLSAGMEYLSQIESLDLARTVVSLARVSHDAIIVDTGGRMCPLAGALMRLADTVLVLVDDSTLGISAIPAFVTGLTPYLLSMDKLRFVCAGTKVGTAQIARRADPEMKYPAICWELPAIPADSAAGAWPATGKTLFSCGTARTRRALATIARGVGLRAGHRAVKAPVTARLKELLWPRVCTAAHLVREGC